METRLKRALGFLLAVFSLALFLSYGTVGYPVGYSLFFLFGHFATYFLYPFLFSLGLLFLFAGRIPKFQKRILDVLGFGFLALGFLFVFAPLSGPGKTSEEFFSYVTSFLTADTAVGMYAASSIGSGYLGYFLSSSLPSASWVYYLLGSVSFLFGLMLLLLPFYWPLMARLKARIAGNKARRASAETIERAVHESVEEEFSSLPERPSISTGFGEQEERKTPSRLDLYAGTPRNNYPSLEEVPSPPSLSRTVSSSGLRKAVFLPDEEEPGDSPLMKAEAEAPRPAEPLTNPFKAEPPLAQPVLSETSFAEKEEEIAPTVPAIFERLEAKEEIVSIPEPEPPFISREEEKNADIDEPFDEIAPREMPEEEMPELSVPPSPFVHETPVYEKAPSLVEEEPELPSEEKAVLKFGQKRALPHEEYEFPGLDLLKEYPDDLNREEKERECGERTIVINKTLEDLKAGAKVVGHTIGPSVTRYDVQTDSDVSVSSVSRFIKDISVRLGGVSTRFEEVVRGKSTSGLEIANTKTTIVPLREMIADLPKGDKYNLYVPFGKSISGETMAADLADFPHLLVAGSTGSGKSIFMHGLIMSLIMRNRPEDLRLVVIDPKRVEMAKYKELPHLLCPIVKEPTEAKVCLDRLIEEMERRFMVFESAEVSNIRQFNTEFAPEHGFEKMPFIVVVVDEYADLADTCKNIGESIVRIAQKARAAGIHLVIATQRPSVNVITGVIKANLPVRVALSVASQPDSVTILGQAGAEDLVGHGDMLVDCSLISRQGLIRCQGCYVDNREIKAVADYIRAAVPVSYDERFLDLHEEEEVDTHMEESLERASRREAQEQSKQDFYSSLKEWVINYEYTSISKIQREFSVGFTRAGKLFSQLQKDGLVAMTPDSVSSSKGCRVLVRSLEELERLERENGEL